jgi:hypothetical protein
MKHRISPAVAISLVALFFSMTGAGFAASRYIITSTSQIKPSVRHALKGHRGPRGPQGTAGATGATGATGAQGIPGAPGPAGTFGHVAHVFGPYVTVCGTTDECDLTTTTSIVDCPLGTTVTGGGMNIADKPPNDLTTETSQPFGNSWEVTVTNNGPTSVPFHVVALCAS